MKIDLVSGLIGVFGMAAGVIYFNSKDARIPKSRLQEQAQVAELSNKATGNIDTVLIIPIKKSDYIFDSIVLDMVSKGNLKFIKHAP